MARSEYFYRVINNKWADNVIELKTVPHRYMYIIVRCLYYNPSYLNETVFLSLYDVCNEFEVLDISWYQLIIYCDLFLLDNLSLVFQKIVIKHVNTRNCLGILKFANTYNCKSLAQFCSTFIAENFNRTIHKADFHILNHFHKADLMDIRNAYFECYGDAVLKKRLVPIHPEAINNQSLLKFAANFQINADEFYPQEIVYDDDLIQLLKSFQIRLQPPEGILCQVCK